MKEIHNIIEFNTNTETKRLLFATRYLVEITFTFDLSVVSGNFCGTSHFCVRRDELAKMCFDLTNMHSTLSGTTIIEDNDSDGFVQFKVEENEQVDVRGQIGGTYEDHFVKFKFLTDQTSIPQFIYDFQTLLNIS